MGKKYVTLVICAAILFLSVVGTASARILYVDDDGGADFTGIQEAVNIALPGDTIIVYNGTYTENVDVTKSLTIRSASGNPKDTIVQAANSSDHVFNVSADYVTISGFTVKNANGVSLRSSESGLASFSVPTYAGIYLESVDHCNISNNTCSNNTYGIRLDGITVLTSSKPPSLIGIRYSNNNRIFNNTCSNNTYGIHLCHSNNNHIFNNTCSNNIGGITFSYSENNKLKGNNMFENGIVIQGNSLREYTHEIDETNTANGKPVYYLKDKKVVRIPEGAGQVILVNCTNITVENQNLNNASSGIQIAFSSYITIKNNNCSNNSGGIALTRSNNNCISNNNCSNNFKTFDGTISGSGIQLIKSTNNSISNNTITNNMVGISVRTSSNNNLIYLNNFINNVFFNAQSYGSMNTGNSEKMTYTYNGKRYKNHLGNYWSDYTGTDKDGDGIGDTPYRINSDKDDHPLMEPWENYFGNLSMFHNKNME